MRSLLLGSWLPSLVLAAGALAPLPARAQLAVYQTVTDGIGGVDGLAGVRHLTVSPDGRHLYAAGRMESGVAVFSIGVGGGLTFVQVLKDDSVGGTSDGLQTPSWIEISPDNENAYVSAYNEFAASAFTRDGGDGQLAFLNEVANPACCGVFTSHNALAVSPDGANVYTVSNSYTAALTRASGGAISLLDYYSQAEDGFGRAFAVAVSPDGLNVYVASDKKLHALARGVGGALAQITEYEDGVGGVDGLDAPSTIAISPDGLDVYVGTYNDSSLTHFRRDPATGTLTFMSSTVDVGSCPDVNELLVLPDGSGLVASCLTTWIFFERDPATGAPSFLGGYTQEALGASQIYSTAIVGEVLYVSSELTHSIIVVPEPGAALGAAAAAAVFGGLARRRSSRAGAASSVSW